MADAKPQKNVQRKVPKDLLAIDFGSSGTKLVRFRKIQNVHRLIAVELLPALAGLPVGPAASFIPKSLTAHYAALSATCESAVVRMTSVPGHPDSPSAMEKALRENMGLDTTFRMGHFELSVAKSRETRVLAVAAPDEVVKSIVDRFSSGPPAPRTFQISGLAALSGCMVRNAETLANEAVCLMDCGSRVSTMAVVNKGQLILVRKLEVGGDSLLVHLAKQFSVDETTAMSFITEGALDISSSVRQVMEPFIRQLVISKDFVERQENCRISRLIMTGGMCLNRAWVSQIEQAAGLTVTMWNPFDGLLESEAVIPAPLAAQSSRFAAAVGVGLIALESAP